MFDGAGDEWVSRVHQRMDQEYAPDKGWTRGEDGAYVLRIDRGQDSPAVLSLYAETSPEAPVKARLDMDGKTFEVTGMDGSDIFSRLSERVALLNIPEAPAPSAPRA